jgi:hypothetical protein
MSFQQLEQELYEFIKSPILEESELNELFDVYDADDILFLLVDKYGFRSLDSNEPSNNLPSNTKTSIIRKDSLYRNSVIKRDSNKCVITRSSYAIQVAHILDFKDCINNMERYDPNNGILLSADLHILFDSGKLFLNPINESEYLIQLHESLHNESRINYLHGQKIKLHLGAYKYILRKSKQN